MRFEPLPRERAFIYSLDIELIQRLLWPLFGLFVILAFADVVVTLLAVTGSWGFVELNPFASRLFQFKFEGFLFAYLMKYLAAIPLFFMITLKSKNHEHDFEVRLLKFTAFVVLVGADIYLGFIVLANNLPLLVSSLGPS